MDPMTGDMKALSNSPDAATAFFNGEFIGKDTENNSSKPDTDGDGKKGHVGLSNFQYIFEERNWMPDQDSEGEDGIAGKDYLAAALEAATTGHPAGALPGTGAGCQARRTGPHPLHVRGRAEPRGVRGTHHGSACLHGIGEGVPLCPS
ncbi:hypothetical protein [Streptomyces sp. C10-9-1]|uniref:hypothetical protein n=1 Tax=Streptomyces sp. C10-9-1 TaxID=1859285 RepID=UPI003D745C64